jgi:hypothetical protein
LGERNSCFILPTEDVEEVVLMDRVAIESLSFFVPAFLKANRLLTFSQVLCFSSREAFLFLLEGHIDVLSDRNDLPLFALAVLFWLYSDDEYCFLICFFFV